MSSVNSKTVKIYLASRTLPVEQKLVQPQVVLSAGNFRALREKDLVSMVDSLRLDTVTILMYPKWWENYVRLARTYASMCATFADVEIHFCWVMNGSLESHQISMPTSDNRNAVMMSFDSLIFALVGRISFVDEGIDPREVLAGGSAVSAQDFELAVEPTGTKAVPEAIESEPRPEGAYNMGYLKDEEGKYLESSTDFFNFLRRISSNQEAYMKMYAEAAGDYTSMMNVSRLGDYYRNAVSAAETIMDAEEYKAFICNDTNLLKFLVKGGPSPWIASSLVLCHYQNLELFSFPLREFANRELRNKEAGKAEAEAVLSRLPEKGPQSDISVQPVAEAPILSGTNHVGEGA
jgi:hypothetical protein